MNRVTLSRYPSSTAYAVVGACVRVTRAGRALAKLDPESNERIPMYWTMLRRELLGRKRQTIIVAAGLAIAIALVIIVSALSNGVRQAQSQALESVYGVGTDLTVAGAPQEPGQGGGPRFDFGEGDGSSSDGTTRIDQSRLTAGPGRSTLEASTVGTISALAGVQHATGVLSLNNVTFSGEMPDRSQMSQNGDSGGMPMPPSGGSDGSGGSSFGIDSFSVLGVDPGVSDAGPLSSASVESGRAFASTDAGQKVALVDQSYASSAEISLGDSVSVGGTEVEVVGILSSTTDEADTAANVYLPIDTARSLAGLEDVVTSVYVTADSAAQIDAVQREIETALPDATVSSQADLASQVSGSLSSAASLITNLGTWLSAIVLVVAVAIAMLLTSSGVSRRTREFGTLKAIGWSNGRVVSQLAGESTVQALIGGVIGLALGLCAIGIINAMGITISGGSSSAQGGFGGRMARGTGDAAMGGPGGGTPGGFGRMGAAVSDVVLHAPVTLWIVVAALGLSVVGGLLAGALGAWRAARLSPVEALRTVG